MIDDQASPLADVLTREFKEDGLPVLTFYPTSALDLEFRPRSYF
jgi:hypothetical protein